ncbi:MULTISPECIES: alpha/beta fold hydrolase [unclassified Pseudonocardia]|uniref:alpha/beta fold hydrolase n=1 Tax=unclassified Pseudonocardia TaxID=2619320 RepID=UPI000ABA747C|nr:MULTISPECIES: alpha/beta hydrolase [unclassified Pseudonocardia]
MHETVHVHDGDGPTVLLLAGGAASSRHFFPGLVEGLRDEPGCRVIEYDRPGTGLSTESGTFAEASSHLHRLVTDLQTGPVVVVGQSLGGAAAASLAHDHPDDVAGLVLLDPTPINEPTVAARMERAYGTVAAAARLPGVPLLLRYATLRFIDRSIRRRPFRPDCVDTYRRLADTDHPQLRRSLRGLARTAERFRETDLRAVPTVVVTADRKAGRVNASHRRLAEGFGGTLATWPGSTHAMHLEFPDRTLATVRDMVARTAP